MQAQADSAVETMTSASSQRSRGATPSTVHVESDASLSPSTDDDDDDEDDDDKGPPDDKPSDAKPPVDSGNQPQDSVNSRN